MNGTDEEEPRLLAITSVRVVFVILYCIVFMCCTVGNLLTLLAITLHDSMLTVTNFFLANLAAVDLFVGVVCVLQNMIQIVLTEGGTWPFGRVMCYAYVFTVHAAPAASAGILVLLSIERYIAVLHPILVNTLLTKRRLCLFTLIMYALCIFSNVPYLYQTSYITFTHPEGTVHICTKAPPLPITWSTFYMNQSFTNTLIFMLWYILPLVVLLVIYTNIGRVLWRSHSQMRETRRVVWTCVCFARCCTHMRGNDEEGTIEMTVRNNEELPKNHVATTEPETDTECKVESATPSTNPPPLILNRRTTACDNGGPSQEQTDARRRVIRLLVTIVCTFAVLTLPHYLRQLSNSYMPQKTRCIMCFDELLQPIAWLLIFANSGINPFLYALLSERFRNAVRDLAHCQTGRETRRRQVGDCYARCCMRAPPLEHSHHDVLRVQRAPYITERTLSTSFLEEGSNNCSSTSAGTLSHEAHPIH